MERPEYIWLVNGEIIKIKSLSDQEFYFLIKSKEVKKIDLDFIDQKKSSAFLLPDGKILYKYGGYEGDIYENVADLKKLMQINIHSESFFLDGLNSYGVNMLQNKEKLGRELCSELNINYNLNPNILHDIDKKIATFNEDDAYVFRHKYFLNIIAIVGDVFSNEAQKRGIVVNWKMEKISQTFSPYLMIKNKRIDFLSYLYEDMFYNFHPSPLEECFLTMVSIYELVPPSSLKIP